MFQDIKLSVNVDIWAFLATFFPKLGDILFTFLVILWDDINAKKMFFQILVQNKLKPDCDRTDAYQKAEEKAEEKAEKAEEKIEKAEKAEEKAEKIEKSGVNVDAVENHREQPEDDANVNKR